MELILVGTYLVLFFIFVLRQWQFSLYWLILILPTYLIRFDIFGLPTTFLEITFGVIFLVWLIKFARADWNNLIKFVKENKLATSFVAIFFLASVVGILVSDMWYYSLGQWRAYFLEPMLLAMMIIGRGGALPVRRLLLALGLSTLSVSVLALSQEFFGGPFAPSLWDDNFGNRVTSFFTTPNAIGLYVAPLFFIILSLKKYAVEYYQQLVYFCLTGLTLIAIYFSFSQGTWIGLGVGLVIFGYLVGYKKVATAVVVFGIMAVVAIPSLRSAVMFADTAGHNRLILWSDTTQFLTRSPQNFVFGAGIRQYFRKVEKADYDPKVLERLIYPHNLFLNFWSEIRLFGMLAYVGLLGCWTYWAIKIYQKDNWLGACLIAALAALVVHGLVDVPYFKNDLAFIFWVMWAVVFLVYQNFVIPVKTGLQSQ